MRANVGICNVSRINLAPHHKRGAHDPKPFLPITFKKSCKCLLRNASHHTLALIHFCRVRFEFSHGRVIWLSRFGKSRIAQLDSTAAQPDFTRNPRPTVCAFIILFETSLGLSLAIPGWEQTSIAEAFLSRPGRSTGFPWM